MNKKIISILFVIALLICAEKTNGQETNSVNESAEIQLSRSELRNKISSMTKEEKEKILMEEFEAEKDKLYPKGSKKVTVEKQEILGEIIDVMTDEVPMSFAWNYSNYLNSNRSADMVGYLDMAYEIEPQNTKTYSEFVARGVMDNNEDLKVEFCQKLLDNTVYTTSDYEYNTNVLNSVENGSYLITNGNLDTYPALVQQEIFNEEVEVSLLNLDLLQNEKYREQVCDEMDIPTIVGARSSVEIVDHILANKDNGEVYLGLTLPHEILIKHSSNLYLSGLALAYDLTPENEYGNILINNWADDFKKKHIDDKAILNKNYLLMLKRLYEYYIITDNKSEAKAIKKMIDSIVENFDLKHPIK